jgi:hypothetical protein
VVIKVQKGFRGSHQGLKRCLVSVAHVISRGQPVVSKGYSRSQVGLQSKSVTVAEESARVTSVASRGLHRVKQQDIHRCLRVSTGGKGMVQDVRHACRTARDLRVVWDAGTLRLLDKGSGTLLASYRGHVHESTRMDCGMTPSDAYVVAGSEDGGPPGASAIHRLSIGTQKLAIQKLDKH